ncbi:MAG: tRNA preQ1(34) S-adenosylmethionine ribosyltransferase-isomerase QueA [Dehalococcoidales bacterium]|nr:tRNA preQ1(34) S-adenosylmethionine ribosyltransferase-isomerase QueA [Dehalococcoidales bacterium]
MRTSDFNYQLPAGLIAQTPIEPRDQSRLMVLSRKDRSVAHRRFHEITDYVKSGDVLVFNESRVIPARLSGRKAGTGARVEILLLRRLGPNTWETLVRPGKRLKSGSIIELTANAASGNGHDPRALARVVGVRDRGIRLVEFADEAQLSGLGKIPLPPYIHTPLTTPERYQTVYARADGSVAAPTAGLHFTPELMKKIQDKGARCLFVTLHIGLDTFLPVREDDPREHPIHREYGVLSQEVADQINQAKADGRRIICVGTTSVRLVEAAAQANHSAPLQPFTGWVDLFILPGYQFRIVDALITNFHLPESTLLMLVSAFAGKELIDHAYREAITQKYRFYSFGDAMLIL